MSDYENMLNYLRGWTHAAGLKPIPDGVKQDEHFMRGWANGKATRDKVQRRAAHEYRQQIRTVHALDLRQP